MDQGWLGNLGANEHESGQLQTLVRDATAPPGPVVSIGVDDVDAPSGGQRRRAEIIHELHDEQRRVRQFFFRDPDGNVINVVSHR